MTTQNPTERIRDLSARIKQGETIPKEELAEAIRLLRADRYGSAQAKKVKEKAKEIDLASLFGEGGKE